MDSIPNGFMKTKDSPPVNRLARTSTDVCTRALLLYGLIVPVSLGARLGYRAVAAVVLQRSY
jgi:hypothetical protein